jgi:hypothetical protein
VMQYSGLFLRIAFSLSHLLEMLGVTPSFVVHDSIDQAGGFLVLHHR